MLPSTEERDELAYIWYFYYNTDIKTLTIKVTNRDEDNWITNKTNNDGG